MGDERFNDLAQLVVTGALAGEKRRPLACITRQRRMKQLRDLLPPLRVHEDLARFERRTWADPTSERLLLLAELPQEKRRPLKKFSGRIPTFENQQLVRKGDSLPSAQHGRTGGVPLFCWPVADEV